MGRWALAVELGAIEDASDGIDDTGDSGNLVIGWMTRSTGIIRSYGLGCYDECLAMGNWYNGLVKHGR